MPECQGCKVGVVPDGAKEPLCYDCLYLRYIAYRAENAKNFKLLCETEERLAKALFGRTPR